MIIHLHEELFVFILSIFRNQWSSYVKRCNEMITFLTAATLLFVPIRYIIDEHKNVAVDFT